MLSSWLIGLCLTSILSESLYSVSASFECDYSTHFHCRDGECVDINLNCDGKNDCRDGSDEAECDKIKCTGPSWFRCSTDNVCIEQSYRCDGNAECPDKSDEDNCSHLVPEEIEPCLLGDFSCSDGICLMQSDVCNGERDCTDGSDEEDCVKEHECDPPTLYKCKNKHCILHNMRCDGIDDCGDNSDETDCFSARKFNFTDMQSQTMKEACNLENGFFLCSDGKRCLLSGFMCNNQTDCYDGSDEGPLCYDPSEECSKANCQLSCLRTPSGAYCACPEGRRHVTEKTCRDIDECTEQYDACSQTCQNFDGYYQCNCTNGYQLQTDGHSCRAMGGEAVIVFSTRTEIRAYSVNSQEKKNYFTVARHANQAIGVAYDGFHVFWTEVKNGQEMLMKSELDGDNEEAIVVTGLSQPEEVNIDWLTSNVYFTDADLAHIGVCSYDGKHCSVIIDRSKLTKPRGLALHPDKGEMYFSDWGPDPFIGRSYMDGSGVVKFVSSDLVWPNGLCLDYSNDRLYWVDAHRETLESIKLDGSDRRRVLEEAIHHPYAVAVFEENLYFSDWKTKSLQVCNKFSGKNRKTLLKTKEIYGINIYHPSIQQRHDHACMNSHCTHLCLLQGDSHKCACPEDKVLDRNGHECNDVVKQQYLLLGAGKMLTKVYHQILGRHDYIDVLLSIGNIEAIVYDNVNGNIIIYDGLHNVIYSLGLAEMEAGSLDVLVDDDLGRVGDMAYDYVSNTLYWCDSLRGTVEVMSITTKERAIVLSTSGGEIPISLCLVSQLGIMYVAIRGPNGEIHVDKQAMDGRGARVHVIEHGLDGPTVRLRYESVTEMVYISDSGSGRIEKIHHEGTGRYVFRNTHSDIGSLAALESEVFWVNKRSNKLRWVNIMDTETSFNKKSEFPHLTEMRQMYVTPVLPSPSSTVLSEHPCGQKPYPCSHVCLQSERPITHSCLCPPGYILEADNATCTERVQCDTLSDFVCIKSNVCVDERRRCDGVTDCQMGEDEAGCAMSKVGKKCDKQEYQCKDGDCIPHVHYCDQHRDCWDNSDEDNCTANESQHCMEGQRQCEDGVCIDDRMVCDGKFDCKDHSDEMDCNTVTCQSYQFKCQVGNCIPHSWVCDGQKDCDDNSDEHYKCSVPKKCEKNMFRCMSGRCIDSSLKCDGNDDCLDYSDEDGCPEPDTNICKVSEFTCPSDPQKCIPSAAWCNGTAECPGGADEVECPRTCRADEFRCSHERRCIPIEWLCDGANDCRDGSDEDSNTCLKRNITRNPFKSVSPDHCKDGYLCRSGQCIDLSLACDGHNNCQDGSDERGVCDLACLNNRCEHDCVPTPRGARCGCATGYKLADDALACHDVDECSESEQMEGTDNKGCPHHCQNVDGGYICTCYRGYALRADQQTCKAIGKPAITIYTIGNELRALTRNRNTLKVLHKDETRFIAAMDALISSRTVYFTTPDNGRLNFLNIDSKKLGYVSNLGSPSKMAVDWVTKNVVFVDDSEDRRILKVCNVELQKCADLQKIEDGKEVTAITIDAVNHLMFYCTTTGRGPDAISSLHKSDLDGLHDSVIIEANDTDKLKLCSALVIDHEKRVVYYAEQEGNNIGRVNYEGNIRKKKFLSNRFTIKPAGLSFFEDHLYFSTAGNSRLTSCLIYGTKACSHYNLERFTAEPFLLFQESLQRTDVQNPCQHVNCDGVCVLTQTGAKCLCEDGKPLVTGATCNILEEDKRPYFWFADDQKQSSRKSAGMTVLLVLLSLAVVSGAAYVSYKFYLRKTSGAVLPTVTFRSLLRNVEKRNTEDTESTTPISQHTEFSNPLDMAKDAWGSIKDTFMGRRGTPYSRTDITYLTRDGYMDSDT